MLLIGTQSALAQNFPKLSGRVVDAANLLSPEQEAQLSQMSAQVEAASSRQFVVATIPDLQDYPIEDYGYRLGREWGIGQEGANNGILLIVAPNERKVRIEVGYGLEPIMTDALSNRIIRNEILPRFRDGDMAGGIMAGAGAIAEQMQLPLEAAEQRALEAQEAEQSDGGNPVAALFIAFWILVILFILFAAIGGGRGGGGGGGGGRRRYRGGLGPVIIWGGMGGHHHGSGWGGGSSGGFGGFGGGGFGGGGGSFGGGGASGSW
ncbi:TPM domain-containing protein [Stakelama tenebrarum]|uniref:Methanol dehydrogenase n=1 Tax=Stakelama tenebrarum TaxID=2711215 RepID=A0A6G6YAA7_9SPHN|nr:TPM domain-containing protein [Sphingosinithalassobacter tenebrarum]QIG81747.1 methanol dehydrogenase [Sphingosinithalassobacter tenebrarum]